VTGCASCQETLAVVQAMQQLATQTVSPTPPPYHVVWLRAEYARRQRLRARRGPVQFLVPAALAVVLVAALFLWTGAPPRDLMRESIDLAAGMSRLLTGGVGLAVLLGFVMLAFVLMEEPSSRDG
jgi:hypothetical protein